MAENWWVRRSPHLKLLALVILYMLVGSAYIFVTPVLEKPDEEGHYGYIRYLRAYRQMPPADTSDPWLVEAKHPPLYYITATLLTAWLPDYESPDGEWSLTENWYLNRSVPGYRADNRNAYLHPPTFPPLLIGVRYFSLLLGLGVVLIAHKSAELLFPSSRSIPLSVAALVGFQPKFMYIMSAVNNDAAINLLGAVIFYLLLYRLCRENASRDPSTHAGPCRENTFIDRYYVILVGVLLGLSSITKVNGLVYLPLTGLALLLIHRRLDRAFWQDCIVIGVLVLVIGGWWYARNAYLYQDPLLLSEHMHSGAGVRPLWDRLEHDLSGLEHYLWANPARSFVSPLPLDYVMIWWGRLVMILLFAALILKWDVVKVKWRTSVLLLSWPVAFFVLLIGFWNRRSRWPFGRLLFPSIVPLSILYALSWWYGIPHTIRLRWRRIIFIVSVALVITSTAMTPFVSILPLYKPWAPWSEDAVDAPVHVVYKDPDSDIEIARLLGYSFVEPYALPDTYTPIKLCWEALGHTTIPYAVLVQLLDVSTTNDDHLPAVWGARSTYPGLGNLPTDRWQLGKTFCDTILVHVDSDTPTPQSLELEVGFIEPQTNTRLEAHGPDGSVIKLLALPGIPVVASAPEAHPDAFESGYVFDDALELQVVEFSTSEAGSLRLDFRWQVLQPVSYDATMFVHLVDAQGNQIAQVDQQPLQGRLPTSYWLSNQVISDTISLPLSVDARDADLQVAIGLYTWPSMERIPVMDAARQPQPDHVVWLDLPNLSE